MTPVSRYVLLLLLGLGTIHYSSYADTTRADLKEAYKKIGDELVSIKKEYPQIGTKVYAILDRVDSLYKAARVATEKSSLLSKQVKAKESEVKEVMKTKDLENSSLQNEVIALKSVLDSTQHKLEVATKNLELEKSYSNKLSLEIAKISHEHTAPKKESPLKSKNSDDEVIGLPLHRDRKNRKKIKSLTENSILQSLNLTSSFSTKLSALIFDCFKIHIICQKITNMKSKVFL